MGDSRRWQSGQSSGDHRSIFLIPAALMSDELFARQMRNSRFLSGNAPGISLC
jgi:hypothetical protein